MVARFDYAWRKTREAAEAVIEDGFAEGIIGYADHARVEKRGKWFVVTMLF